MSDNNRSGMWCCRATSHHERSSATGLLQQAFSVQKGAPFSNRSFHALKRCFQPAPLPAAQHCSSVLSTSAALLLDKQVQAGEAHQGLEERGASPSGGTAEIWICVSCYLRCLCFVPLTVPSGFSSSQARRPAALHASRAPVTESQNGRGWKGPLWVTQSSPLPKQGHPEQAAQDLVQVGLEYLQRRRVHNLPEQPVPGLHRPQREEVLPPDQLELPLLQFVPIAPCPVTGHHWKESGPILLTPTLQIFIRIY